MAFLFKRSSPAPVAVMALTLASISMIATAAAPAPDASLDSEGLPFLGADAQNYRTPRAGEGFRTGVFGEDVTVPQRDLRHVKAWKLGAQFESPSAAGRLALPAGALYFWDHPDSSQLFRAEVAGAFNNVLWTRKPDSWGDFEYGLTFTNFTLPEAWNEAYDGATDKAQQIYWGWVRPGLTLGYRRELGTGHQDNMWQINWILEPGYFYSGRSSETSPAMVLPKSTFELRNRLMMRYDRMERNILSLPHEGYAFGADFVQGFRANWANWGTPNYFFTKNQGQNYSIFSAYAVASGRLPSVASERHRWVSWFTGGVGHNVDRFNGIRVGGGPNAMGMEYGSSVMPILPGTSIWGFYPEHYMIGALEYRWELAWFTYLSAHSGLGWLNPYNATASGQLRRSEQLMPWMGARVSTGFFGDTMLMLDYAYSFNNASKDTRGTNEVMLWLSGEF